MSPTVPLAAASALVSVAFGLITFDRWLLRRRRHDMAWTVAMALFAVAAGALWWAAARGWSAPSFRLFFLVGAVVNVPWLALGTVYLLAGQRIGDAVARWLLVFSGFAAGVVFTATTRMPITGEELPKAREVFEPIPRILVAFGSAIPALVIFVGALWSVVRVLRRRQPALAGASRQIARPRWLVAGNLLIALGAAVLTSSGSLAGRLGEERAFAVTLLAGICALFAGFLVASQASAPGGAPPSAAWRVTDDEIAEILSPARDAGSSR